MSVQCAARFTSPSPVDPAGGRDMPRRPSRPAGQCGLGAGAVLLLSGGAAASAWGLPAAAHAQAAPAEEQEVGSDLMADGTDIAASMPVSPWWSSPAEEGTAEGAPAAAAPRETVPAGAAPSAADPTGSEGPGASPTSAAPPEAAPGGAAPAESGPAATVPPAARERIQDRLAQGTLSLRSGETLWSLTGELLGPHATAAEIAQGWPLLWEANADQVRDPDRVAAGTVLQVPPRLLPEQ